MFIFFFLRGGGSASSIEPGQAACMCRLAWAIVLGRLSNPVVLQGKSQMLWRPTHLSFLYILSLSFSTSLFKYENIATRPNIESLTPTQVYLCVCQMYLHSPLNNPMANYILYLIATKTAFCYFI